MKPIDAKRYGLAAAAALVFFSPLAQAVVYKWVDEHGSVTYSNTPPADPSKVKNFIAIEDSSVPADKRPKEADAAAAKAEPASKPQAAAAPATANAKSDAPAAARPEAPSVAAPETKPDGTPRTATRAWRPEAVQDPCLRSADPMCYQRHKDKYHPYLGYAPSVTTGAGATAAAAPAAVGSTSSAAAGGAVGGQIRMAPIPAAHASSTPKVR